MGISIGGLISGMDTDTIITQLLNLQKKPILQLQQKEADYRVKLSAYSTLQGNLKSVKNAAKNLDSYLDIRSYSATSSNTSLITAVAENTAAPGSYSITVQSLATAHKLTSSSFSPTEAVGAGTIHLALGSNDPVDIAVGPGSTISDVAKAINDADTGIYASVINDGANSYLTLSGKQTGEANVINLTVTEDGTDPINQPVGSPSADEDTTGLSRLLYVAGGTSNNLVERQGAADSKLIVDGLTITRATNTITDVISGITLNLKESDPLKPVTIAVERSDELFTTRLNEFIAAYNGLVDSLSSLQSYDSQTQQTGALFGDSTTRRIQSEMRSLFSNSVPGLPAGLSRMTDLGVTTNEDGKLELDASVFDAKLKENYDDVVKFFTKTDTGAEGFAVRMAGAVEKILDANNGSLTARTKGIDGSIDDLDDQIAVLNKRMSASETRLRAQFAALEAILGKYQSISDSLTADLKQIENIWGTNSN
jgi:flagellar hook-associated protein 2